MELKATKYEVDGPVATLTLSRPASPQCLDRTDAH